MKENVTKKELNALLSKKVRNYKGKNYTNLVLEVTLNNGVVVTFEVAPRFANRKLECLLKHNINEVK